MEHRRLTALEQETQAMKRMLEVLTTDVISKASYADRVSSLKAEWLAHLSKEAVAAAYLEPSEDLQRAAKRLEIEGLKILSRDQIAGLDRREAVLKRSVCTRDVEKIRDSGPKQSKNANDDAWQPLIVRQMPGVALEKTLQKNQSFFTRDFLILNLGKSEWSPGFYYDPNNSLLPGKAYWMLDRDFEPYLPTSPGRHGAKLTAFFNKTLADDDTALDEVNSHKTPVFIRCLGEDGFRYFGNDTQSRFSDRLDYDRMQELPKRSIRHHAEQLAAVDRPEWVTKALRDHFWPRPQYEDCTPKSIVAQSDSVVGETSAESFRPVLAAKTIRAMSDYICELQVWEKDAGMKTKLLTIDNLMKSFDKADADEEPSLRLQWEYLEFVEYDHDFHDFLVALKHQPKLQRPMTPGQTAKNAPKAISMITSTKVQPSDEDSLMQSMETLPTAFPSPACKLAKNIRPLPGSGASEAECPRTSYGDIDIARQLQREHKNKHGNRHDKRGERKSKAVQYVPPYRRAREMLEQAELTAV